MKTKILMAILSGLILMAGCKGARNSKSSSADSTTENVLTNPKLIKTADINFKVKNVQQTGEAIAVLTNEYKGMVMHHQMQSNLERSENVHLNNDSIMLVSAINTTADMVVKIPSEKLEEFMNKASHMGILVIGRKMDIEDKSLEYISSKLKQINREELVSDQKMGKVTLKHPAEALTLKDDIVDKRIADLKIDEDVTYSTISLKFYQSNTINKEIIANDDPSEYNLPFFNRLGIALGNGWDMFKEVLIATANIWIIILAGLGVYAAYKLYKKKSHMAAGPVA